MSVTNSGFNVNLLFLLSYVHEWRKTVNQIFDIPFENKVPVYDINQYNRVHKKRVICNTLIGTCSRTSTLYYLPFRRDPFSISPPQSKKLHQAW